jgi:hypothetical protein
VALAASSTPAHANSPPCQYYPNGGTVTDAKTGLTWQQAAPSTLVTLAGAQSACAGLSLGGIDSWRLPTISELVTLVHEGQQSPAIDPVSFPGSPTGFYWSSTVSNVAELGKGTIWGVYFGEGNTGTTSTTSTGYVRCVHD